MMRKNLYIFFLMLAVTALLVHTAIPHHEHGRKVCFEQVSCDGSENTDPAHENHSCCLDKQEIIRSQNENEANYSCDLGIACDLHFPPIILFLGDFFELDIYSFDSPRKPYINLYTSADIYSANSLRGPPQV